MFVIIYIDSNETREKIRDNTAIFQLDSTVYSEFSNAATRA